MNISIGNLGGSTNTSVSALISQLVSKRTQSLNTLLEQKSSIENTLAALQGGMLNTGSINSSYSSQIASLQDTIDRLNEQYAFNANKITTINSLKKSYSSTVSSLDKYIESLKNPNSANKDPDIYLDGNKGTSNDKVNVTVNDKNTNIQEITLDVTQIATTSVLKSEVLVGGNVTKNTKVTDLFAGIYDVANNAIKTNRQDIKESLKLSELGVTSGSFNLGSATITVDAENDTIGTLIQKIKNAGYNASIETAEYDSNGEAVGRLVISGDAGKSIAITSQTSNFTSLMGLTVTEGNFYINGASFEITDTTTIGSLMADINSASADNVGAKLEDGKLVFVASQTGEVDILVEKGTSNFTNAIGFTVGGVMNTSNLVMGSDGSYVTLTGQNGSVKGTDSVSSGKFTAGNFNISFNKIDEHGNVSHEMQTVTIEVTSSDTVNSIIEKIKNQTKGSYIDEEGNTVQTGLTAEIVNGHLVIRQTQKGAEFDISVEAGSSNFTNYVGMTSNVSNTTSKDAENSYLLGTTVVPNSGFTEGSFTISTNKVSDDGKTALFETISATIDVTASDTKESIAQKITDAGIGLTASITADGYFKIEQNNAGADFDITIQAGATNFTEKAGLTSNVMNTGVLSPGSDVNQFTSMTGSTNVSGSTAVSAGSFMINGVTIQIDAGNINSAIQKINSYTDQTGVNAYLKDGNVVLQANKTGPDYTIYIESGTSDFASVAGFISKAQSAATATVGKVGDKSTLTGAYNVSAGDAITGGTIKINGYQITLEDGTLSEAVNKINEYSAETGVTAAIKDGKLVFTNTKTGSHSINIEAGSSNFTQVTGTAAFQTEGGIREILGGTKTTMTASKTGLSTSTAIESSVIYINGQKMQLSGTLGSAMNTINGYSSFTGVEAYLNSDGKFVLANTQTGAKAINFTSESGNFSTVIGGDTTTAQIGTSDTTTPIDAPEYIRMTKDEAINAGYTVIESVSDLQKINDNLSGKYILMNDINLSGVDWTPLGEFKGTLDGNGYSIKNLTINTPDEDYVGLFSKLNKATIKNLGIENANITGGNNVGVLAGRDEESDSWSEITNSYFSGNVNGQNSIGGIIGSSKRSLFENIRSEVNVTGNYYVGGFVGNTKMNHFDESIAAGKVTGSSYTGAFVGYTYNESGINSYNNIINITDKTQQENAVGNPVDISIDEFASESEFQNKTNSIGPAQTGTFINAVTRLTEEEAIAQGYTIIKTADDLDRIRENKDSEVIPCLSITGKYILMNDIDLSGYDWVTIEDFIGIFDGNGYEIKNINNALFSTSGYSETNAKAEIRNLGITDANITIDGDAGVLATSMDHAKITNCYTTGNITAYSAGGLIHEGTDTEIDSCWSSVNITAITTSSGANTSAGGLVDSISTSGSISNSYATGTLSGFRNAGGFVRTASHSTISKSFYQGTINSNNIYEYNSGDIGGFIASAEDTNINNCYVDGNISAKELQDVGGFISYIDSGTRIYNGYSNTAYSGDTNSNYNQFAYTIDKNIDSIQGKYVNNGSYDAIPEIESVAANTTSSSLAYSSSLPTEFDDTIWYKGDGEEPVLLWQVSKGSGSSTATGTTSGNWTIVMGTDSKLQVTGSTEFEGEAPEFTTTIQSNLRVYDYAENESNTFTSGSITIKDTKFNAEGKTLQQIVNEINTSGIGVTASLVAAVDEEGRDYHTLKLEHTASTEMGSKFEVTAEGDFARVIGLGDYTSNTSTVSQTTAAPETGVLTEAEAIAQGYTVIKTANDLKNIKNDMDGKYILMADINLSGQSWARIGSTYNAFTGELNGNGHRIVGLRSSGSYDASGLFAALDGATVKNLYMSNTRITGSVNSAAGAIAGIAMGGTVIDNVITSQTSISLTDTDNVYVGGLVGLVVSSPDTSGPQLTISNVVSTSTTILVNANTPSSCVGGILGGTDGSEAVVDNVMSYATRLTGEIAGGIVGFGINTTVTDSLVAGSFNPIAEDGTINPSYVRYKGAIFGQSSNSTADNVIIGLTTSTTTTTYNLTDPTGNDLNSSTFTNFVLKTITELQANPQESFASLLETGEWYIASGATQACPISIYPVFSPGTVVISASEALRGGTTVTESMLNSGYISQNASETETVKISFNRNGVESSFEVTINSGESLTTAIEKINAAANGAVTLSVKDGKLVVEGASNVSDITVRSTGDFDSFYGLSQISLSNAWTEETGGMTIKTEANLPASGSNNGILIGENTMITESEALAQGYTLIESVSDLQNIQNNLSGKYILMNDIDLSSLGTLSDSLINGVFTGEFNGNGYTISGLSIGTSDNKAAGSETTEGGKAVGLFRESDGAVFKNVKIDNATLYFSGSGGALVGLAKNTEISNVLVDNSYVSGGDAIGHAAGGIAAAIIDSTITNSSVQNTTVSADIAGGLVGISTVDTDSSTGSSVISNSNTNNVSVMGLTTVGGFIGQIESGDTITRSYSANSTVISLFTEAGAAVGGFIGYNAGDISHSYAASNTIGYLNSDSIVGGFIGENADSTDVNNIYTTSSIAISSSGSYMGAVIGINRNDNGDETSGYWDSSLNSGLNAVGSNYGPVTFKDISEFNPENPEYWDTTGTLPTLKDVGYTDPTKVTNEGTQVSAGSIIINGHNISISGGSIEDVIDQINAESSTTGVVASLNSENKFMLQNADGSSTSIEIQRGSSNILKVTGIKPTVASDIFSNSGQQIGSSPVLTSKLTEEEAIAEGYTVLKTAQDLQNIANNLSGKYILMNDIDLSGIDWNPLGEFTGELNGNGFAIENLTINKTVTSTDNSYIGFFSKLGDGSLVTDITFENASVTVNGNQTIPSSVGVLAGSALADEEGGSFVIRNVAASGNMELSGNMFAGGLVGSISSTTNASGIQQSSASVNINYTEINGATSLSSIGGLVGGNSGARVVNNYADGKITMNTATKTTYAGGLAGYDYGGYYYNNYTNNGSITLNSSNTSTSAKTYKGSFIGFSDLAGRYVGNYYYQNSSSDKAVGSVTTTDVTGITHLTQSMLSSNDLKSIFAGWDQSAWDFSTTTSNGMPVLNRDVGATKISSGTIVINDQTIYLEGGYINDVIEQINNESAHTGVVASINSQGRVVFEYLSGSTETLRIGAGSSNFVEITGTATKNEQGGGGTSDAPTILKGGNTLTGDTIVGETTIKFGKIGNEFTVSTTSSDATINDLVDLINQKTAESGIFAEIIDGKFVMSRVSGTAEPIYSDLVISDATGNFGKITGLKEYKATAPLFTPLTREEAEAQGYTIIDSVSDLKNIKNNLRGKYILMADIDLSGTTWTPIGSRTSGFKGTLDGNGYTIKNLKISKTVNDQEANSTVGLFARTENGSMIKNLTIEGATVKGGNNTGVVAGTLYGNAYNIKVTGVNVTGWTQTGGAFGAVGSGGKAEYIYVEGTVQGYNNDGGVSGGNSGTIKYAYSDTDVTGTADGGTGVGGIVGFNNAGGIISNAFAKGKLSGQGSVGGIAGYNGVSSENSNNGTIEYSYAETTFTNVGNGLVGSFRTGSTIRNSYWNTQISGKTSAGQTGTNVKGLTTSQAGDASNFTGWSSSIWTFENGKPELLAFSGTTKENYEKTQGVKGYDPTDLDPIYKLTEEEAIALGYTVIKTSADLQNINNNLSGKYILMNNIDLSGVDWTAIGGSKDNPFTGELNGNGFTISNLTINETTIDSGVGLFGNISGATIKNVKIENASVTASETGTDNYVGILTGNAGSGSIIEDVTIVNSTMQADATFVGAIAGSAGDGTIINKVNVENVTIGSNNGVAGAGVIIGFGTSVKITNSIITNSDMNISIGYVSGNIAGAVYESEISNVYVNSNITSGAVASGALVGAISGGHIDHIFYDGQFSEALIGGIGENTYGYAFISDIYYSSSSGITSTFPSSVSYENYAIIDTDTVKTYNGNNSVFSSWNQNIWNISGTTPKLDYNSIFDNHTRPAAGNSLYKTEIPPQYAGSGKTFTISSGNGIEVSVNITQGMTLGDLIEAINADGDYIASFDENGRFVVTTVQGGIMDMEFGGTSGLDKYLGLAQEEVLGEDEISSTTGTADEYSTLTGTNNITGNVSFSAGDFSITVDGNTVNFDVLEGESLTSVINKINASGLGVSASIQDGKLVLTAQNPGAVDISLKDGTSNFAEIAGFINGGGIQLVGVDKGVLSTYTSANTAQSAQNSGISAGDFFVHLTDTNGNITDTVKITIGKNEKIDSIIEKINNSGLGVTASINDSGKMVITRNSSETAGGVLVTKGSSDFTNKIGFTSGGYQSATTQYGSQTSIVAPNSVSTSKRFTEGDFIISVEDNGTVKDYTIDIESTDSIYDVIDKINAANTGVTASLNSNNKLVLTKDADTGEGSISISKGSSDFTTVLGFTTGGVYNGTHESGVAASHTVLTSDKLSVSSKATMASMGINGGTFRINGVDITIKETDTIEDVIGRINSVFNSAIYDDIAVTAEFKNNQIVLTTKNASSNARIEIEAGSTNFTEVVGFTDYSSRNNVVDMGQNANFNIKIGNDTVGTDYDIALDLKDITNDNIYNGNNLIYLDKNGKVVANENQAAITIEIKKTGETTIKIGQNLLDASLVELNKFVANFNKAMISSENAILSDDADFAKIINNVKAALTDDVADMRKIQQQLADIGITVDIKGGENSNMGTVRIYLDKQKYTDAFYADSQHVMDLLIGKETVVGVEDGVLTRLNNVLYPEVNNNNGYFNSTPRVLSAVQKELKREITRTTFELNELRLAVSGTPATDGLSEYLAKLEEQYRFINEAIANLNSQYATSVTRLILNQNNPGFNPIVQ